MSWQEASQWRWDTLIEEDVHLSSGNGAAGSVLQYSTCLLKRDAGEEFDDLTHSNAVFEVLKKRRYRHASALKHPRPTDALGIAFDCRTTRPINHLEDGSTMVVRGV